MKTIINRAEAQSEETRLMVPTLLRLDTDTREMLEALIEHYAAVLGAADMSLVGRIVIRRVHKEVFPDRWHGEYFKPEKASAQ